MKYRWKFQIVLHKAHDALSLSKHSIAVALTSRTYLGIFNRLGETAINSAKLYVLSSTQNLQNKCQWIIESCSTHEALKNVIDPCLCCVCSWDPTPIFYQIILQFVRLATSLARSWETSRLNSCHLEWNRRPYEVHWKAFTFSIKLGVMADAKGLWHNFFDRKFVEVLKFSSIPW